MQPSVQPPKDVVMPDINSFPQSEYAFYAKPRGRGGYTKYALLGDQNYNDIREANGLPQVPSQPNYPGGTTHPNYPQQRRPQPPPSYPPSYGQHPGGAHPGGAHPGAYRGRGAHPGGVSSPSYTSNTHHRVNALPQQPQQNAHVNYQPPIRGPTDGAFRNNPSLGTAPALGLAPPPSGVQYGDPGNILPSGAPPTKDGTYAGTRFIKEGYGTYRGTGVGKSEEETRGRDTRSQVQAMHNHTVNLNSAQNYELL